MCWLQHNLSHYMVSKILEKEEIHCPLKLELTYSFIPLAQWSIALIYLTL